MSTTTRRSFVGGGVALAGVSAAAPALTAGTEPEIRIDVSVCFDSAMLLWVPLRIQGAPGGLELRPLRRLDDGSLRSAIVRMPPQWTSGGKLRTHGRLQIYVLSGEMWRDGVTLGQDAYLNQPAGSVMPEFGSKSGVEFLLVCDGPPAFSPTAEPALNGDVVIIEHGAPDRSTQLWEDDKTGATMSLIRVNAGWTSPGPEYHPCNEEIFCLSGDIAPDDIRLMRAGWYLWNPAYGVHGFHLHSVEGATVLEWHDRAWAKIIYEGEVPGAQPRV